MLEKDHGEILSRKRTYKTLGRLVVVAAERQLLASRHCQPKEQLQPDMAKKRHQALDRCHGSGYWLLQAPSLWELLMEELLASQRQSWHSPRQFLYRSGTVTYGLLYLPARRARRCSFPCTVSMPWTMPLKAAGGNSAGIQISGISACAHDVAARLGALWDIHRCPTRAIATS